MESPSLETFKLHLGTFLWYVLQLTLPWEGLGLDDLHRTLPPLTIL